MEREQPRAAQPVRPAAARTGERAPQRAAAAALLALAALTCCVAIGRDLSSPDEGRYAQVAEEIRSFEHGVPGLFLLHLNGAVYDQKPPLWFWLAALAGTPGGRVSEAAARVPSALACLASVFLVMQLGTRLLGRRTGLVAGAVLLTCAQFVVLSRRASLDALLTCFTTLALTAFWRWESRPDPPRAALAWLHAALGLAVLTKGPVGFLVPGLAIAAYLGWQRRLPELRRLVPAWGLALSLGPGLAWVGVSAALAPEGYLASAVGDNLVGRFFAGTHEAPFHFYLEQFPKQFLPWTLAWPLVWWAGRRRVFAAGADPEAARAWRFLLAWVGVTLLFFSISSGKRGLYLLPAYPGAALLCADALVRWRERRPTPSLRADRFLVGLLGVLAAGAAAVGWLDPDWTGAPLQPFAVAVSASLLGTAALLGLHARGRLAFAPRGALLWLGLAALQLSACWLLQPAADAASSTRRLATRAAQVQSDGRPIALYGERSLLGGLAYYSGRRPVALPSQGALRALLETGEAVLVFERRDLAEVEEIALLDVVDRIRVDAEHFVVASARGRYRTLAAEGPLAKRTLYEAAR